MIRDFMEAVTRDLAPGGTLRVALSFGNSVVVQQGVAGGGPRGVAVDLADELARRLSVPRVLVGYPSAASTFEAGMADAWDLAFLSIPPGRHAHVDFTAPFMVLEGTYLVRDGTPFGSALDLDHDGVRIAVGRGGFYDLHLTRVLRHAELVRAPTLEGAIDLFLAQRLDAVAGLREPLVAASSAHEGLHVMQGRFAGIEQAIAVPKGRSAGLRYLNAFLEQMKDSGRIAGALRHGGVVSHEPLE